MTAFEKSQRKTRPRRSRPEDLQRAFHRLLQIGETNRSSAIVQRFSKKRFESDPAFPDVAFIGAEADTARGRPAEAAKRYQKLIGDQKYRNNGPTAAMVLRGRRVQHGRTQPTSRSLKTDFRRIGSIKNATNVTEALLLAGQAQLKSVMPGRGWNRFAPVRRRNPNWARSGRRSCSPPSPRWQAWQTKKPPIGIWKELVTATRKNPDRRPSPL